MIAGLGGTAAVVSANAWMNQPGGFTLNDAGYVVDVQPLEVIFNDAMPYETMHMFVAAYLVGGFMVASVYAVGMLRGRRDRYHRLGFLIPFTVAAIACPIQMLVGDTVARWVYRTSRRSSPRSSSCPRPPATFPRPCSDAWTRTVT